MIFSDTAVALKFLLLGRTQTHPNASYKLIAELRTHGATIDSTGKFKQRLAIQWGRPHDRPMGEQE